MISGVSVTFRFAGVSFGKAIVVFGEQVVRVASSSFDRSAIRTMFGVDQSQASLVASDLATRALRVAGHFRALGGRYPFSLDPETRIEANVVEINPDLLPQ